MPYYQHAYLQFIKIDTTIEKKKLLLKLTINGNAISDNVITIAFLQSSYRKTSQTNEIKIDYLKHKCQMVVQT